MASVAVCWLLSSDQTRHKLSAGMMQKWVKAHHTGKVYFTNLGSEDACTKPGAIYDLNQSVFHLTVSCGSWMRNLNRVEQPNLLLFRPRLCPSSQRHCTQPSQRLFLVPAIILVIQKHLLKCHLQQAEVGRSERRRLLPELDQPNIPAQFWSEIIDSMPNNRFVSHHDGCL